MYGHKTCFFPFKWGIDLLIRIFCWFICFSHGSVFSEHLQVTLRVFTQNNCNIGYMYIDIILSFNLLPPAGQLEPWQHSTDLRLRGQDSKTLGCWCRYGRHHLQNGHWCGRPAAGLPVAEGPPPQHLLVRIHQLSGQEQPWPAHTYHQGQTLEFKDAAPGIVSRAPWNWYNNVFKLLRTCWYWKWITRHLQACIGICK